MDAAVPRTLGRWDLVLLKIVAIVNINNVPPVAVYGWASLGLWTLASAAFFIPEATPEQMDWFNELQRITTSPENAARLLESFANLDVR